MRRPDGSGQKILFGEGHTKHQRAGHIVSTTEPSRATDQRLFCSTQQHQLQPQQHQPQPHTITMPRLSIEEIDEAVAQVASDLEDMREKRAVVRLQNDSKEDILRKKMNKLDQRLIKRRSLLKPHEYTEIMEKLQTKQKLVPGMVIRQQAELVRSLHLLEALEKELDHTKDQQMETYRILNFQIKQMHCETDMMELSLMNKLCIAEQELNTVKEQYTHFMQKIVGLELQQDSMSTTYSLCTLEDEDEDEEQQQPVKSPSPRFRLKSMFFRSPQAKTPEKQSDAASRRRSSSSARQCFTSPPPREQRDIRQLTDRQRMLELLTSS